MPGKKILLIGLAIFFLISFPALPAWSVQAYWVLPGETLFTIAQKNHTTVTSLLKQNSFVEDPSFLAPYQVVVIPDPKPGTLYTVKADDSLYTIANANNISQWTLAAHNDLEHSVIYPGQSLIIPQPPPPAVKESKTVAWTAPQKPAYDYNIPRLQAQFPYSLFLHGPGDEKVIALTFDDGPDSRYTPQILDVLNHHSVPGTFFLVGNRISAYPEVTRAIVAGGHQVAGHSWSHSNLRPKTSWEVRQELVQSASAFWETTRLEPLILRPPYGELSEEVMNELVDLGYTAVNWSVDSGDWRSRSIHGILTQTLKDVGRGSIILMHSTGGNLDATLRALPDLIYALRAQGYRFVTVSQLLDKRPYR